MPPELAGLDRVLRRRAAPVRIWWRDDDAGRDDPRLARLLDLATHLRLPVTLAVVPAWLEPAAARRIAMHPSACVAQHGWDHVSHAAPGERPIELGGLVDRTELCGHLRAGWLRLQRAFGARLVPVMVPPWNRIAADVATMLPALGYRALSASTGGSAGGPPDPLVRLDVDLDLVDRASRRPLDAITAAQRLTPVLERSAGRAVGVMTHHRVNDEAGHDALSTLLAWLAAHPAVRFCAMPDLIAATADA